ncbi:MAG: T9SS type A sorting domain-containing protein [Janthinobacterium lividum]
MGLFIRFLTLLVAILALPFQGAFASTHTTLAKPARTVAGVLGQGTVSLNVYPNPAHGIVSIQLSAPSGQDYKFRINNVLGREMRLLSLRPELTASTVALDVSNLPAGLYFYSLLVNDHVVSTSRLTLQ